MGNFCNNLQQNEKHATQSTWMRLAIRFSTNASTIQPKFNQYQGIYSKKKAIIMVLHSNDEAFYNVDSAQEEDIVFTRHHSLCKMNCNIPYFIDLYHLKNYYQIHCKMLKEQKAKILVIQDPCCFKNPIPKLYNAEVLIAAILQCESLPPKIKIISPTLENLKFMRYELDKMLCNTQVTQNVMMFIQPTEKMMLDKEREEDLLRQQANFSLSQIQFQNDI